MRIRWSLPLVVLMASCSFFGKKPEKKKETKSETRLVGRVASLPIDSGYALIEAYGAWNVPTGSQLITVGNSGKGATLTVSGEKASRFAAADIQAGTPQVGDLVYFRPPAESSDDSAAASNKVAEAPKEETSKKSPEVPPKS